MCPMTIQVHVARRPPRSVRTQAKGTLSGIQRTPKKTHAYAAAKIVLPTRTHTGFQVHDWPWLESNHRQCDRVVKVMD